MLDQKIKNNFDQKSFIFDPFGLKTVGIILKMKYGYGYGKNSGINHGTENGTCTGCF